jgi:hypothetical protein
MHIHVMVHAFKQELERTRAGAHRNNTRIQKAFASAENDVREQQKALGDRNVLADDRQQFVAEEDADERKVKSNFSAAVNKEVRAVKAELKEKEDQFYDTARTAFSGLCVCVSRVFVCVCVCMPLHRFLGHCQALGMPHPLNT